MKQQASGVTLVELLVSIGITVAMLLMTSLVFKSSTEASGRAMARSEIMHQLRAVTRQLDQDFTALRPEMPMAIIFEEDADDVREDRIWFFANGDYQTKDYDLTASVSGNIAHIFYGQSLDAFNTTEESSNLMRRILTRREKILTADTGIVWLSATYGTPAFNNNDLKLDYMPVDNFSAFNGVLNYWKNRLFTGVGGLPGYSDAFFRDDSTVTYSVIRRSAMVLNNGLKFYSDGDEGFQRLYMANDVTDFKIEIWFEGATEWFPNATDLDIIVGDGLDTPDFTTGNPIDIGFYWNAPEDSSLGASGETHIPAGGLEWRGESALGMLLTSGDLGWTNTWPQALRFTFTLYDKNRRHFPFGETFSYIVKLPAR